MVSPFYKGDKIIDLESLNDSGYCGLGLGAIASSSRRIQQLSALILVLVWAFYSAQIVLLGAEFTHAYSGAYGSRAAGRDEAN